MSDNPDKIDLDLEQYTHRVTSFFNISHLFTNALPRSRNDNYQGLEKQWTLYAAREKPDYPPVIIADRDGYVQTKTEDLALRIEEDTLDVNPYLSDLPKSVKKKIIGYLEEHGYTATEEDLGESLVKSVIFLTPIPKLRSTEFLRGFPWRDFVDSLASFRCDKDPRLNLTHKAHLLRGFEPKLNPHSIQYTNAGTGKTTFYDHVGRCFDKVTPKSFLGFAKSPEEIYLGVINGAELPIAIDQIESGGHEIMRFLFNAMESGRGRVSAGAVEFTVECRCSFHVLGNPIGYYTDPSRSFAQLLDHISENSAMGRRFGIIIYGTDFKRLPVNARDLEEWDKALTFFRAVEEAALKNIRELTKDPRLWDWVRTPIEGYQARISEITGTIENESVRTFLREHAGGGQHRVRSAALNVSVVTYLDKIALGEHDLNEILATADEYLNPFIEINIGSAINIVRSIEEEVKHFAESWFKNAAEYLREIVSAVELTRRLGIGEASIRLASLNHLYKTGEGSKYSHLSKCIDRLKRVKLVEINEKLQRYFGFSLTQKGGDFEVFFNSLESCPFIKPVGSWGFSDSQVSQFLRSSETGGLLDYTNSSLETSENLRNLRKGEKEGAEEVAPEPVGVDPPQPEKYHLTLQDKLDRIGQVFMDSHNIASTDYIASKIGIDSMETEKLLKNMERNGLIFRPPGQDFWRWGR